MNSHPLHGSRHVYRAGTSVGPSALRLLGAVLALGAVLITVAPAAQAHPLGNFTVNHYHGFRLHPDRIDDFLAVDSAEIAAAQEKTRVDSNGDHRVTGGERAVYARDRCAARAAAVTVAVSGSPLDWTVRTSTFRYQRGEAGLRTSRLECRLTAPAELSGPADIRVQDRYDAERLGWHEMTASGQGVRIEDSPLAEVSTTRALREYPDSLLSEPLDQRRASFRTEPGKGTGTGTPFALPEVPGAGPITAALEEVRQVFHRLVGARELTLPVGLLALVLALVLGASHAALPGHGKTIMAAYLAGRRGRVRDAVTVGATVTVTHTAGVLILGLVLPLATSVAGETVLGWLGLASGLLVTMIGCVLLRGALRGDRQGRGHGHHHHHGHGHHTHHHGQDHHHHGHHHTHRPAGGLLPRRRNAPPRDVTPSGQSAGVAVLTEIPEAPARPSPHTPTTVPPGTTGRSLVGLGIAGGLVPSPSALVVLLGAAALGRTPFGVLLVLGYGAGMAATLTAAGILLVRLRDRLGPTARRRWAGKEGTLRRLSRLGPVLTSALILAVGLGLTARALTAP
ncbi:hypothetical protein N566_17265 [Streptomycetaceae bacterium MP113-05]|nr:hypothetical protein N566_17265 [Streptomycetaceae bacterium MP113-05]